MHLTAILRSLQQQYACVSQEQNQIVTNLMLSYKHNYIEIVFLAIKKHENREYDAEFEYKLKHDDNLTRQKSLL